MPYQTEWDKLTCFFKYTYSKHLHCHWDTIGHKCCFFSKHVSTRFFLGNKTASAAFFGVFPFLWQQTHRPVFFGMFLAATFESWRPRDSPLIPPGKTCDVSRIIHVGCIHIENPCFVQNINTPTKKPKKNAYYCWWKKSCTTWDV